MTREARYLHICEALQHQIGSLPQNSLLPSEHDLARRFGVSRVTIRRALGLLERSGVVSRQRGRGTTVNPAKITRWLSPMYPFEQDLRRQGIKFETRILEYARRHIPPDPVPERLRLPRGAEVGFLALQRLVDDRIICLDRRYLPPDVAARFDPQLIVDRAVADVLCELAGQPIASADWTTEIVAAPREVAAPLGITPGVLILMNMGTEYLPDGSPIQVHTMCYRIDRVRFQFAVNYATASSLASHSATPPDARDRVEREHAAERDRSPQPLQRQPETNASRPRQAKAEGASLEVDPTVRSPATGSSPATASS